MGHNETAVFSFTVASIDVIDYYRFERNPADSLGILTEKGYKFLRKMWNVPFSKKKVFAQKKSLLTLIPVVP